MLSPGLSHGGVSNSLQYNTTAACEKNPLEKGYPRPETLEARKTHPETTPPGNGIT